MVVNYQSDEDAFKICGKQEIDYLIIRGPYIKDSIDKLIKWYSQKTIVWSHNLENYPSIRKMQNNPYIIKNVCVSNEQLYWLKDTKLYKKSTYIYNGVCFNEYKTIYEHKKKFRMCYIGNLYPRSGIETVASMWKIIHKKIPTAELWIIGGNNLYNTNVMRKSYSKKSFARLDRVIKQAFYKDGKLDEDVHFTGVLRGRDKLKIMASAQVGIANVTDAGDTFGLGVVEFQALGVPVVSIGKYGMLETVKDGSTGILVNNRKQMAEAIVRLLNNPSVLKSVSENTTAFVCDRFEIKYVVDEWYKFLNDPDEYNANIFENSRMYNGKYFLKCNSCLKEKIGLRWLPSTLFYKYINYLFKRILEKAEIL